MARSRDEVPSLAQPAPLGEAPDLPPADPRTFGTQKSPLMEKMAPLVEKLPTKR